MANPSFGAANVGKLEFLFKLIELILGLASIAVVVDLGNFPLAESMQRMTVIHGTQVGFVMISLIVLLSLLWSTPPHKWILVLIGIAGCGMSAASGGMIIHFYRLASFKFFGIAVQPSNRLLVCGVISIVNALVYLIDTALNVVFIK